MTEEEIRNMLEQVPGSKRAVDGIVIETDDGSMLHLTGTGQTDPDLRLSERFLVGFCTKNEILRLRDLRTARDYLLRVRAEAIADSPRAVRAFRKRRTLFEQKGRRWSLMGFYDALNFDAARYVARLPLRHKKHIRSIPHGLAPINEANAIALKSLLGDVVMVSENLRYFYYFMNISLYGESLGIETPDCVDAAVIALRIMRCSETFDFDLDPRATLPSNLEKQFQSMTGRQMEFTFGHEFAHLIEGHLTEEVASFNSRVYAFECEFAADRQAVLLPKTSKKERRMLATGAYDVLLYLHFLESAFALGMLPEFSVSVTHPPALERLRSVLDAIEPKVSGYRGIVEANIKAVEQMADNAKKRVEYADRPDILTFYGSMYLPNYTGRLLEDRIEF
jgi:hypothetical protein